MPPHPPADPPRIEVRVGDVYTAASNQHGLLFVRIGPEHLRPGEPALAYTAHGGALKLIGRRDHAGGFVLLGEAVAPTPHRPSLTLRAATEAEEGWDRTLGRAGRLIGQLTAWLDGELAKDEGRRDLEALVRVRRDGVQAVDVLGVEVTWSEAHGCWWCLDRPSGEVVRLDADPITLHTLIRAGSEALSLAGRAWAYSLEDRRTPVAVIAESGAVRARRVRAWTPGQLIAYQAGMQVLRRR